MNETEGPAFEISPVVYETCHEFSNTIGVSYSWQTKQQQESAAKLTYVGDVSNDGDSQVLKDMIGLDQLTKLRVLCEVNVGAHDGKVEFGPVATKVVWTIVPLVIANSSKVVSQLIHHLRSDISLLSGRAQQEGERRGVSIHRPFRALHSNLRKRENVNCEERSMYLVVGVKESTLEMRSCTNKKHGTRE